jgi:hypothetical protein
VPREAWLLRQLLRPHAAVRCGQADHLSGIEAQAARAFQGKDVRRVGDDFGAAQRRDDLVLAGQPDHRTDAERRQRRELDRFEGGGGIQQLLVERQQRALIDHGERREPVAFPLLHQCAGGAPAGAVFHHVEQHRPQPAGG